MADAFSFLVSALASSARPDDAKRRKELDAIIKKAGVEAADSSANPDAESAAEDTYESTDEGMRRKRKGS